MDNLKIPRKKKKFSSSLLSPHRDDTENISKMSIETKGN